MTGSIMRTPTRCVARSSSSLPTGSQRAAARRYRHTDSGTNTASSTTEHASDVTAGCCNGHAGWLGAGDGLPKRWRIDATVALIGFQSATGRSHAGSPWVGTNVLARNVNGNSQPNVAWSARVGLD